MPVSTDTFRQQRILHLIFAVSALVLFGSVLWLVIADYHRPWRDYQRQARLWQTAMTVDAADQAMRAQQEGDLDRLRTQIVELESTLPHGPIAQVQAQLEEAQQAKARLVLPAATIKGQIGPKTQQLERARLARADGIDQIQGQLEQLNTRYRDFAIKIARLDQTISRCEQQLNELQAQESQIQKQIDDLLRLQVSLEEKLAKLNPQGLARLSDKIRNAPLLDWFNPTEKVQQVISPDIRTDLNFLTVETIDRCNTCHINIDNPAFEENNLLLFAERQIALHEGQDVDSIPWPVVFLTFWEQATGLAGLADQLELLGQQTLEDINRLRAQCQMTALEIEGLAGELNRIAKHESGSDAVTRAQWYAPRGHYLLGMKQMLRDALGAGAFAQLRAMYRQELIQKYNTYRQEAGLSLLSANAVLLGHPRLDLFVDPDSPHPVKTMGCTSCHEGSGQETDFHHAAHTPQDIWVDAQTGVAVPAFLLDGTDDLHPPPSASPDHADVDGATVWGGLDGATVALAGQTRPTDAGSPVPPRMSHSDVKLTDPLDPAPFAPLSVPHGDRRAYRPLGLDQPDQVKKAVSQAAYWSRAYGWHRVHYMEWEKPMHRMAFIQSSCNKCHTEVFDIKDQAPTLFEGRTLFAQLGCVNCHAVDALTDDLDIKKVGPSLAHVKHKLSGPMIASWIWAPKAFRPTTKMPHYFMLENNSSPVDILRTRTEVAAMTRYLMTAPPSTQTGPYQPEPIVDTLVGDPVVGKRLFNSVGCLACHSQLDEHGQKWIVQDLIARGGIPEDQATERYRQMNYNQRHWYVMEHVPDKLERAGPELSGVGTKLKAGKDPQQAEKHASGWLYDWLRNPQHYSSYTIMPSFRLSPQEAQDLAAYLLTLERPGYQPADFLKLDDNDKKMLAELVAQLKAAGGTLELARQEVSAMSTDVQLEYLGKKMIGHYGCNGCHLINGFEDAASACTNLDDWGLKDPHKLDFGYFDHKFDHERDHPIGVWKVDHEGVGSDAPQIKHGHGKIRHVDLSWESMQALERRPWLYHKLHNPRVYDRGRTTFEGYLNEHGRFDVVDSEVGKPYDKLKMPKFFLTDPQVQALTTYVTSVRKPLVSPTIRQAAVDPVMERLARGRQVATLYNCYGCHNIEGNTPHVWEFFDVYHGDGSFNYEALNNAPPRLIGQGAKTQPQWLHGFLQDVHELRPWLKIRMPSFPISQDQSRVLVDYFAGASQAMARYMDKYLAVIEKYRTGHPDDGRWFTAPSLAQALAHLEAFAVMAEVVRPDELNDHRASDAELAGKWNTVLKQAQFLQQMNDVPYPFAQTPTPRRDAQWFARGQALFKELRCYQCHALGDEQKLLELWKLDNPADDVGDVLAEDDGGLEEEEDDPYGDEDEEEGYGYDSEDEQEALPAGPVYSAPNLSHTARRLRWDWVDRWLQEPGTMQPGTKMPQWFPDGRSAFANYPGSAKQQMHGTYGYTGPDQRRLLLDFLYEAGVRGYTPGHERLMGVEPVEVKLPPLPAPEPEDSTVGDDAPSSAEGSSDGVNPPQPASADQAALPKPSEARREEPVVSSVQLHDQATLSIQGQGNGRIVGVVKWEGKKPKRRPIRMNADTYCTKSHKGKKVLDESMKINDDGSMRNVLIYVKSDLTDSTPPPRTPVVIDQVDCLYRPHVVGLVAGQPIQILNSDHTLHNVKMNSTLNGSFNEGMPVPGMQLNKVLSKPELGIQLKCDVHPWMGALVHVLAHRFFSVSDVEGRFEIENLPPGVYTFEAIHETAGTVGFDVTVEPDTSHRVDVTLR